MFYSEVTNVEIISQELDVFTIILFDLQYHL